MNAAALQYSHSSVLSALGVSDLLCCCCSLYRGTRDDDKCLPSYNSKWRERGVPGIGRKGAWLRSNGIKSEAVARGAECDISPRRMYRYISDECPFFFCIMYIIDSPGVVPASI